MFSFRGICDPPLLFYHILSSSANEDSQHHESYDDDDTYARRNPGLFASEENYYYRRIFHLVKDGIMPKFITVGGKMLKQLCFPAVSNALALPGGNGIFAATPTERITHYTLQAKSCAKGQAPLETPDNKTG